MNEEQYPSSGSASRGSDGRERERDAKAVFETVDVGDLRESLRQHESRIREFVLDHPIPVLLGAVSVGYLLARVARLMREDG